MCSPGEDLCVVLDSNGKICDLFLKRGAEASYLKGVISLKGLTFILKYYKSLRDHAVKIINISENYFSSFIIFNSIFFVFGYETWP